MTKRNTAPDEPPSPVFAVAGCLANIGEAYEQYSAAFSKNGIEGRDELLDMEVVDLQEMGVASKMHRNRILKEVAKLKEGPAH